MQWHDDYAAGREAAQAAQRPLLVWFYDAANEQANAKFQAEVLSQSAVAERIQAAFLAVKVPLDAQSQADGATGRVPLLACPAVPTGRLIEHEAFAELRGQAGLAIVDVADEKSPTHGMIVSIYPLARRSISPEHLTVLLDLPPGTLTQRTLVFAVRTHPSRPAGAAGDMHPLLAAEAAAHSRHQARINIQGHHHWDARFQSINARLPAGHVSYEVCAESWPGQSLFDAAEECVESWSQSSGHWAQVSRQAEYYAYDMQRGTSGIWYATGIFGRRR
ncbi:MAG: hypothetical protein L0211_08000 [Planctomycetaceae bacterium]|nr:hypothetical protein [Planctomycetaceae bacterium]